jgi:hypothetical protein
MVHIVCIYTHVSHTLDTINAYCSVQNTEMLVFKYKEEERSVYHNYFSI